MRARCPSRRVASPVARRVRAVSSLADLASSTDSAPPTHSTVAGADRSMRARPKNVPCPVECRSIRAGRARVSAPRPRSARLGAVRTGDGRPARVVDFIAPVSHRPPGSRSGARSQASPKNPARRIVVFCAVVPAEKGLSRPGACRRSRNAEPTRPIEAPAEPSRAKRLSGVAFSRRLCPPPRPARSLGALFARRGPVSNAKLVRRRAGRRFEARNGEQVGAQRDWGKHV